jgi:hypothetical protein
MCDGRFGLVRRRFGWKQFVAKPAWIPISPALRAKRIAPGTGWNFWPASNDARRVGRVTAVLRPATVQQAAP